MDFLRHEKVRNQLFDETRLVLLTPLCISVSFCTGSWEA